MARRKALTAREWEIFLPEWVAETTQDLGQPLCLCLTEDEDSGDVRLCAQRQIVKAEIKTHGGRFVITTTKADVLSTRVYRTEVPIVVALLRKYQQPDPDFDANLDDWRHVAPSADVNPLESLERWC